MSEGSRYHQSGRCKPCAFFHTRGCQNGVGCCFCHQCPPQEAQRRKRVRRQLMRSSLGNAGQGPDVASIAPSAGNGGGGKGFTRANHSRQSSGVSSAGGMEASIPSPASVPFAFPGAQHNVAGELPSRGVMPPRMPMQAFPTMGGHTAGAPGKFAPALQSSAPSSVGHGWGAQNMVGGAMSQDNYQYMMVPVSVPMPSAHQPQDATNSMAAQQPYPWQNYHHDMRSGPSAVPGF